MTANDSLPVLIDQGGALTEPFTGELFPDGTLAVYGPTGTLLHTLVPHEKPGECGMAIWPEQTTTEAWWRIALHMGYRGEELVTRLREAGVTV